jgi:hypothetical protein
MLSRSYCFAHWEVSRGEVYRYIYRAEKYSNCLKFGPNIPKEKVKTLCMLSSALLNIQNEKLINPYIPKGM